MSIMTETKVNSDLLKCENDFFLKESKTKSLLITKAAKKCAISGQLSQMPPKTEKISSSVLNRAKQFLAFTKTDDNIADKCDLVDENESEENAIEGKQMIEMNLMLFENKKHSKNLLLEEEESESKETSDSDSEDSEDDTTDSEHSDIDNKCDAK